MYVNFLGLRNILDFGVLIWISLFWKCITDSRMLCMNGIGTVVKKNIESTNLLYHRITQLPYRELIEMHGFSLI